MARGRLKRRKRDPIAIVIHTTGSGPRNRVDESAPRFARWRRLHPEITEPFDAALWIYRKAYKYSPHYVVGQDGRCTQIVLEDLIAEHVGRRGSWHYRRRNWARVNEAWWYHRFPDLQSPRQFGGGRIWDGGANANTIGIEVVAPYHDPSGPWSEAAWDKLSALVTDLCWRHDIPCTRRFVVTHSDVHPRARSAREQPWDPGPRQWSWSEFARRAGAPF